MNCFQPNHIAEYFLTTDALGSPCYATLADTRPPATIAASFYLFLFLATCTLEAPIYYALLRTPLKGSAFDPAKTLHFFVAIVLLNLCTHPLVVFGFPSMMAAANVPAVYSISAGELFALVAETFIAAWMFKLPLWRTGTAATAANLFSWIFGGYVWDRFLQNLF